jgi:hypothetical protein
VLFPYIHHQNIFSMAPGVLAPEPTFVVTPMTKTAKEKHNFGAVIEGIDLENICGEFQSSDICCDPLK